jgi:hypothetical protein
MPELHSIQQEVAKIVGKLGGDELFRGRSTVRRGLFVSFLPAMSQSARKAVGQKMRAWHLNRHTGTTLSGLATAINAQVRGWINYYGAFYRSELYSLAMRIKSILFDGRCRSSNGCEANQPRHGPG